MSLVLAALLTATVPAAEPLKPSGRWMVDYAENACVLQRAFGEGASRVTFGLRPPPLGSFYEVLIHRDERRGRFRRGTARMWVSPAAEPIETEYLSGNLPDKRGHLTSFHVDWSKTPTISPSGVVRIEVGDEVIAFEPTHIRAALKALDACRADLLKTYGLDLAALDGLPRRRNRSTRRLIGSPTRTFRAKP